MTTSSLATSTVEAALRGFLAALDEINEHNPGLTDTEVREVLAGIVIARLVRRTPEPIPDSFQMMEGDAISRADDQLVNQAVTRFISEVEADAAWRACTTDAQRRALIARDDVTSSLGNAYWLYLGSWD